MATPTPDEILDLTVPVAHRESVKYGRAAASVVKPEAIGASDVNTIVAPNHTEATMPANQTETGQDIRAVAREEAAKILAQANATEALAEKIQTLTQAKASAEQNVTNLQAELATLKGELTKANASVETLKGELKASATSLTTVQADVTAKATEITTLKGQVAALNKEVNDVVAEKTVASRTKALEDAGLKSDARVQKATARKEDGTFSMADADFDAYVADLKDVFAAAKAAAAPAAPASPATTPAATPAPATQATASAPASPAIPAAPDMSSADVQARAMASILSGQHTNPTEQGVKSFSDAFGALEA